GNTALAEAGAAYAPAPAAAGKNLFEGLRRGSFQSICEAKFRGRAPQQALSILCQEALAGPVDQAQTPVGIESKNGYINFRHYFVEQRACFQCPEFLLAQT